MAHHPLVILGAGMTGLAAGMASGAPIYEAGFFPGGICSSYGIRPGEVEKRFNCLSDNCVYRFELGGGHWIFGGDPAVVAAIRHVAPVNSYERRSSVWIPSKGVRTPYPIQNHLKSLGTQIAAKALSEMISSSSFAVRTLEEWLHRSFGPTLTDLFFGPFHNLYTAGLWTEIAPQDEYKSPVCLEHVLRGTLGDVPAVGYNTSFLYPKSGLNSLARGFAAQCEIHYEKKAVSIDIPAHAIHFSDGSCVTYDRLISTLPLNRMLEMADMESRYTADPFTSVLVLNIGACRGASCPYDHWIYLPESCSGFHRIGFYSNVDPMFLPAAVRSTGNRVSIYVERSFRGGEKPDKSAVDKYKLAVVEELQKWRIIDEVEVLDSTWIDVAYTWSWPRSQWKQWAFQALQTCDVYMVGRYARWSFQGIADSIRDGLIAGAALKI
jgi:protoporphyrinogen oxidase